MLADRVLGIVAEPWCSSLMPMLSSFLPVAGPLLAMYHHGTLDELFAEADTQIPEAGPSNQVQGSLARLAPISSHVASRRR